MCYLWALCGGGRSWPTGSSRAIPLTQVGHSQQPQPAGVTAETPASPPPGFTVPPTAPTRTTPIPQHTVPVPLQPRSDVQDTVPQDAPYAPIAAVPPAEAPRWSGKRTAAIAAIALALTSAGALAAAAASPNGISAPTEQRGGPGFGGGGGPNRQFGPRGGAQGQQQAPGQPPMPGQPQAPGQQRGQR